VKRRLFTVLAVLSLILCLATAVLWVRSYRVGDSLFVCRSGKFTEFASAGGYLHLQVGSTSYPDQSVWRTGPPYYLILQPIVTGRSWWGFAYITGTSNGVPQPWWLFMAPHWSLALLFTIAPLTWLIRRLRRATPAGLCPTCGYDLRATPDRCPECGNASGITTANAERPSSPVLSAFL
jgi:hypothetical protein